MFYLRDIRKANNLTMKELGEKVGITESAIGMYETGKRQPNYEMLLKLSEALGCEVNDLLYGNRQKQTSYMTADEKELLEMVHTLSEDKVKQLILYVKFLGQS